MESYGDRYMWKGGVCPRCKSQAYTPPVERQRKAEKLEKEEKTTETLRQMKHERLAKAESQLQAQLQQMRQENQDLQNQNHTLRLNQQFTQDQLHQTQMNQAVSDNLVIAARQELATLQQRMQSVEQQNKELLTQQHLAQEEIKRLRLVEKKLQQLLSAQAWRFENDNKGWALIVDTAINDKLSDALQQFKRNPTATNQIVSYTIGGSTYMADLKNLSQRNCHTNTTRTLLPPRTKPPPPALRCRTEIPSFKTALSSDIVALIKAAAIDQHSVASCLHAYAAANERAVGVLTAFEEKCKILPLEAVSVWLYTTDEWVYKDVNRMLRAEDTILLKQLASYIAILIKAIKTLPSKFDSMNVARPSKLFRNMAIKPPEANKYQVGKSFVWNSFTSTSCFPEQNKLFGYTRFEIEVTDDALSSVLFVEPFTAVPSEYEVLIPVGTFFTVLSNDTDVIKLRLLHCVF
eukprot:TRINITY_DN5258_c0_g1_i1.p1 TRINITY_DN5258_c0_g1~~TRINITY_DN5258_c0_g1_i1.p1  ORF type:complete len:498 (+),score=37.17 TRINITY_DN5258_c0_g1_i1:110-1495(+)